MILSRAHLESVVVGAPANFVFTMREEKRRESSLATRRENLVLRKKERKQKEKER